ncbi:MAG: LptF/LptG family permease [Planctomycetes bacterium]|nr:LptF/LptG family permease [Planctomycetota bacterium]
MPNRELKRKDSRKPSAAVRSAAPLRLELALSPSSLPSSRRKAARQPRLSRTMIRYLGVEVVRVMVMSLFVFSLVSGVVIAFQLVRSGLQIHFLWGVLLKSLLYYLDYSLPISLLFGISLGAGRLAGDGEINALRAHGVSYLQIACPLIALALFFTGAAVYLNGEVLPEIHHEKGNLRDAIISQLESLGSGSGRSLLLPAEGQLYVENYRGTRFRNIKLELKGDLDKRLSSKIGERLFHADLLQGSRSFLTLLAKECILEISPDRQKIFLNLQGVTVLVPQGVPRSGQIPEVFRHNYSIENLRLTLPFLEKGERIKDFSWKELFQHAAEVEQKAALAEKELGGMSARKSGEAGQAAGDDPEAERRALEREIESLRKERYRTRTEIHARSAFCLACLTFPAVGIPLVFLTDRRSRLIPFFLGNLLVMMPFLLLVMLGVILGERGFFPALVLAAPNALLAGLAVYLWSKVLRR